MFTSFPRRCVVLLEDIDAAGLNKRQEADRVETTKDEDAASKIGAEITKAFQSVQKRDKDKQGITLSRLLNAIDGVASHEGRVLVMTTNFPNQLDEALICPGRIDMKVAFTNATRSQISELFVRMYSPDGPDITTAKQIKLDPVPTAKGKEKFPSGTATEPSLDGTAEFNGSALTNGTALLCGHTHHVERSSLNNLPTPLQRPRMNRHQRVLHPLRRLLSRKSQLNSLHAYLQILLPPPKCKVFYSHVKTSLRGLWRRSRFRGIVC